MKSKRRELSNIINRVKISQKDKLYKRNYKMVLWGCLFFCFFLFDSLSNVKGNDNKILRRQKKKKKEKRSIGTKIERRCDERRSRE